MGMGLMFGPVLATLLVRYMDYFWTLMTFAIIIFVFGLAAASQIPKRIDLAATPNQEMKDVPFKYFFRSPRIVMGLMVDFVASANLIFMDPILSLRL